MFVLITAEFACSLEMNMIWAALSPLYSQYGDPVKVGWLVTGFTLVSAGSAAICGRLGDLFGRRRVMLATLAVATCGSIISASSADLNVIVAGRALQGCSMAILPLCFGLLREHAAPRHIPFGVGVLGGVYAAGSTLSGLMGGIIVDTGHWQNIFVVSACATVVAAVVIMAMLPRSIRSASGRCTDALGGLLFVPSIASLLLSFTLARDAGWTSPIPIGLLTGGVAGLVIWAWHEARQADPLIDVRLLRNRQVALANLCIFLTGLGPMTQALVTIPLLQQPIWTGVGFGVAATMAALFKFPGGLTAAAASIGAGKLAQRIGMRNVVIGVCVMNVVAWAILAVNHDSLILVVTVSIIMLAPGAALIAGCTPALVMDVVPHDRTSEATGLCQVVRSLGLTIGSQIVAAALASDVIAAASGGRGVFPTTTAYSLACGLIAGFAGLALLAAIALPRQKPA